MKHTLSPFAFHDGRPYLVVNFDLEPRDLPSLPELLHRLLAHHLPEHILILRALTKAEAALLRQSSIERDREAWAQIVASEEARYRGR
jgi:hypothetical protein